MANPPSGDASARPPGGQHDRSKEAASGYRRQWPQAWWLIFLGLMIANYMVTRAFFAEPSAITIPYTFFKKQVEAGNVEAVTSVGDSIQGSFTTAVTYPPPKPQPPSAKAPAPPPSDQRKPLTSKRFKTQRPVFADPGLETLLEEKGVVIEAMGESASS